MNANRFFVAGSRTEGWYVASRPTGRLVGNRHPTRTEAKKLCDRMNSRIRKPSQA